MPQSGGGDVFFIPPSYYGLYSLGEAGKQIREYRDDKREKEYEDEVRERERKKWDLEWRRIENADKWLQGVADGSINPDAPDQAIQGMLAGKYFFDDPNFRITRQQAQATLAATEAGTELTGATTKKTGAETERMELLTPGEIITQGLNQSLLRAQTDNMVASTATERGLLNPRIELMGQQAKGLGLENDYLSRIAGSRVARFNTDLRNATLQNVQLQQIVDDHTTLEEAANAWLEENNPAMAGRGMAGIKMMGQERAFLESDVGIAEAYARIKKMEAEAEAALMTAARSTPFDETRQAYAIEQGKALINELPLLSGYTTELTQYMLGGAGAVTGPNRESALFQIETAVQNQFLRRLMAVDTKNKMTPELLESVRKMALDDLLHFKDDESAANMVQAALEGTSIDWNIDQKGRITITNDEGERMETTAMQMARALVIAGRAYAGPEQELPPATEDSMFWQSTTTGDVTAPLRTPTTFKDMVAGARTVDNVDAQGNFVPITRPEEAEAAVDAMMRHPSIDGSVIKARTYVAELQANSKIFADEAELLDQAIDTYNPQSDEAPPAIRASDLIAKTERQIEELEQDPKNHTMVRRLRSKMRTLNHALTQFRGGHRAYTAEYLDSLSNELEELTEEQPVRVYKQSVR